MISETSISLFALFLQYWHICALTGITIVGLLFVAHTRRKHNLKIGDNAHLSEKHSSHNDCHTLTNVEKTKEYQKEGQSTSMGNIDQIEKEKALKKLAHDLEGRIAEMNCLYNTAKILDRNDFSFNKKLENIVEIMPSGWQYPELTVVRIIVNDQHFKSKTFADTLWSQSTLIMDGDIPIGSIEVCLLEEMPEMDEGPFLKEERKLLINIADQISTHFERDKAISDLKIFREFMDHSNDTFIIVDPETARIIDFNEKACVNLGYSREELSEMQIIQVEETIQNSADWVTHVDEIKQKGSLIFEGRLKRKGGTRLWVETSVEMVSVDNRNYYVYVARDISERKRNEREIHKNRQLLRKTLDSLPDAVFIINRKRTRITDCNKAASDIFEYSRDELIGSSFEVLHEDDTSIKQIGEFTDKIINNEWIDARFECRMRRKDTNIFPTEYCIIPLYDSSRKKITRWVCVVRDLTESKVLQNELAQDQKLKSIGQLAAGIAHEINTPTQFVGDNTRFLKDSFEDLNRLLAKYQELIDIVSQDDNTKHLIDEITETAREIDIEFLNQDIPKAIDQSLEGLERVSAIVKAMKDFAHPEIGEKVPANLNKIIESTSVVARNEWKYVADMNLDLAPDLPSVNCLPGEIGQVILNMIINAAHAIEDKIGDGSNGKGVISIETSFDEKWAGIRISDTGAGIPESVKNHVFDPFFTTKEVGKGTGQGLSISRAVVMEKHGGTICFETKPDEGTTFTIRLPFDDNPDEKEFKNEEAHLVCGR